ncbi:hypothetical protein F3Y22_tig00110429pilonHSYRG01095 [Hibiscus syriacus]|uniref:RNase H type-1 domain-containing protein n=1 Tax=Hibiscus syriacus TaxID=106335 RepID=A0A6A3ALE1_HIBSY|nr:hypothetical protein F3Y22_tig00110429pilonHSYRG01095 [Hibiscus syriacus]
MKLCSISFEIASPLGAFGRDSSKLILFPLSSISIVKLGSWKISVLLSDVPHPMALGAFFSPHWSGRFGRLKIFSFFKMPLIVRKLYFKSTYPGANFTMIVCPFGVHTDCPLDLGWVALNNDGAVSPQTGLSLIGGLRSAWKFGFERVIIQSDCEDAIQLLSRLSASSPFAAVGAITRLLDQAWVVIFRKIYR